MLYFVPVYTYKYCDLVYIALSKKIPTKSDLYHPQLVFLFVKEGYCILPLYQLLNFSTFDSFIQIIRTDV